MKTLNEQQLQTHVPITGWLLIAHGLMNMLGGVIAFAFIMSGSWFWTQLGRFEPAVYDPEATRVFAMFNTLTVFAAVMVGVLVIGLAIPALVVGIGLLARKSWARVLGIVVSVFMLLAVPIGTLIGIYAIIVLMQDAAADYFAASRARLRTSPQPA